MSRNLTDLRDRLFDALDALADKEAPMDLERAKAIADVSQVIINTAKVELEHMRISGHNGTGFIPESPTGLPAPGNGGAPPRLADLPKRRHRLV